MKTYEEYGTGYLVRFTVDYPEEGLDRGTTALRLVLIVPVGVLLTLVGVSGLENFPGLSAWNSYTSFFIAGSSIVFPTALMIIVRRRYPRWWFDWNVELVKFQNRVMAYFLLVHDEYPSTDEEQAVHLEIPYPRAREDLNR